MIGFEPESLAVPDLRGTNTAGLPECFADSDEGLGIIRIQTNSVPKLRSRLVQAVVLE